MDGIGGILIKTLKPKAKEFLTQENLVKLFDKVGESYPMEPGQRMMLVVSKKLNGEIAGSIVGVGTHNRIESVYDQKPLDEVVLDLIEKL